MTISASGIICRWGLISFVATAAMVSLSSAAKPASKPAPELTITPVSDHEVVLSWQKYRDQLVLERKLPDQEIFSQIGVFDPGVREFLDRNLPANSRITYRLRPAQSRYFDQYGTEKSAIILIPPPSHPSLTRIGINSVQVTIHDRSPRLKTIAIQRRVLGTYETIGNLDTTATSFVDSHLPTGSYQYYRVICKGERNDSPPSPPDSIFLDFQPPQRFSYQLLSDHSVRLTWQNSMPFPCPFEIEKNSPQGTTAVAVAEGDTAYIDHDVPYETYIYYRMRSRMDDTYSDYTYPLTIYATLDPIRDLAADSIHDGIVHLNWSNPGVAASDCIIEKSVEGGVFETLTRVDPGTCSFVDSLDTRAIRIRYRVVSVATSGARLVSNEVEEDIPDILQGMVFVAATDSLPAFYVDRCEVTVEQYRQFCEETAWKLPDDPGLAGYPNYWRSASELPAVNVSWQDAIRFCNWRSMRVGLDVAYDSAGNLIADSNGFRLLTQATFVRALEQSGQTGGNFLGDEDGWQDVCGCVSGDSVNSKIQNLLGNAWEWVQDSGANGTKIVIGGGYTTPFDLVDEIPKFGYLPDWKSSSIGFRCMLPADK